MKKFLETWFGPNPLKELGLFILAAGIVCGLLVLGSYVMGAEQAPKHDIVYCGAPWCSGCNQMKPVIKTLEKEGYSVYRPKKIEWPKYRVTLIPTTIVYSNGVEVKRFVGYASKATIRAYLPKSVSAQKKRIKVVIAGYDDRRFAISIMGRVLKEEGIELVHLEKRDYRKYEIKNVPTVIFFENGVEKYRLSACGDCDHCKS